MKIEWRDVDKIEAACKRFGEIKSFYFARENQLVLRARLKGGTCLVAKIFEEDGTYQETELIEQMAHNKFDRFIKD